MPLEPGRKLQVIRIVKRTLLDDGEPIIVARPGDILEVLGPAMVPGSYYVLPQGLTCTIEVDETDVVPI